MIQYSAHQPAKELFKEIYTDRKKLCKTYTRIYFTNGFVSTVISEAKNSSMKAGGRKGKMKKYSMSEQCKMLMSWETHLDAKACETIMNLLGRPDYMSRPWSDFVDAAFTEAVECCQQSVVAVEGAPVAD